VNKLIIEASCEVDGVEYHAVTAPSNKCDGCVAYSPRVDPALCGGLSPCVDEYRADRSTVVWVRAE
jgi:hypothetical protein